MVNSCGLLFAHKRFLVRYTIKTFEKQAIFPLKNLSIRENGLLFLEIDSQMQIRPSS